MHPILALSVLEAVRATDVAQGGSPEGFENALEAVKLGRTTSVAAQIERYAAMVRRNETLGSEELTSLFTLVSRRADADLVFAEAGRLAGQHAAKSTPALWRLLNRILPRGLRERLGQRLIRRAAGRVFDIDVAYGGTSAAAVHSCGAQKVPGGRPCGLYGSALAELLRTFTSFDGAYFRIACRARGGDTCRWSTTQPHEG
jgi:hypothetical protein